MPTLWVDTLLSLAVASGGLDIDQLTAEFSVEDLRMGRMTLLRTIIRADLAATVRDSGEGDQIVDLGIGIVPREAIGNVPDPSVATDHPTRGWIWRARYRVYASAVDDQFVDPIRIDLDLRSKRKLDNGLAFLEIQNQPNQGVATAITMSGLIRQLWLVG